VLWFGYRLRAIFIPILIAFALAYLFDPAIRWIERHWKAPRSVTISTAFISLIAGVASLIIWLGPEFLHQLAELIQKLTDYLQTFVKEHDLNFDFEDKLQSWTQYVQENPENPAGFLVKNIETLFTGTTEAMTFIGQAISTTAYFMGATLLLIPLYFFFFIWHFDAIVQRIKELLPLTEKKQTQALLQEMDEAVATYFRGRLVISLITAVLFSLAWSPWLADVPYWLVLGISAGILNFIPFAGILAWLAAMFFKGLAIGTNSGFDWWSVVLWPSIAYGVVQTIDNWLLTPWIQGRSLNLNSATIIIVVLIGGTIGGIYGLLLCIPIAACAKIMISELLWPHLHQWVEEH
jgi:predicted PurR-regulated permease PerM